jgi:hypothetical protein
LSQPFASGGAIATARQTVETLTDLHEALTESARERAFALVCPVTRAHALGLSDEQIAGARITWRDPIASLVTDTQLDEAGVTIGDVVEAVAFYTATAATVSRERIGRIGSVDHCGAPGWLVLAAGYRAGPAGP